ncbi:Skp family chaperone for outer membrane proteins [Altererythrobacter atlanticus]|uniref:Periplasmic chaperone n=1 Tax=Croceibacterium atlanticum TaxID=1267766 RepID=A0A0F7KRN5_9SPHN|nr:OmpH family outer membrane protein [Croceibacterium atlanticum]AKH41882.1 periplasmic chaperone [Croceibacterium atlanticum]MBB5733555.1 Skp family chaperone for outer membrane proteins [Croceibacterium atlanticum]
MKNILKPALAAGIAIASLSAPLAIAPAAAQSAPTIGIVNLRAIVVNSAAYSTAEEQRQTTYKAQIDQANARRTAIQQQLQPLVQKLQTDSQSGNVDQAALQQQAAQIQQIQEAGQRELQQILAPVIRSQAYVEEQINDQLQPALQAAAQKKGVSLVLTPDTVVYADNSYNINQAVLDELNTLLPSAQIVPPEGWVPREVREQQAQQQAAQAAQAPAQQQPAAPAVSGR